MAKRLSTKQRENTQSNVGHAQENMPYPLLVRSEQERMIDEQLRKKICEQEEKKRTQQTPYVPPGTPTNGVWLCMAKRLSFVELNELVSSALPPPVIFLSLISLHFLPLI
jgi:tryptophan synthase beta subunit